MLITLENISKSIGHELIVDDLSVRFKENQSTVIIGPSGCGKSTVLRLILGLVKPTRGTIRLDNEILKDKEINAWRRQIGYVTQDGGLFPHLTVRGNITLMAQYLQCDPEWIEQRIHLLGELVRLSPRLLTHYPSELSGRAKAESKHHAGSAP